MKTTITICLDQELVLKLKEENNYSDIINQQIKAYYNIKDVQNIGILKENLAKTKQIIKENHKKQREIVKLIEKLKEKEKNILDKCRVEMKRDKRDPISDPSLWIIKGWDKKYPNEWKKHIEFERGEK